MCEQATWSIELPLCPESKSNSGRQFVNRRTGKPFKAKSEQACTFMRDAVMHLRAYRPAPFDRNDMIRADIVVRYPNHRRDFDVELVYDAIQKAGILPNDRQIREKYGRAEDETGEPRIRIKLTKIGTLPWQSKARG